MEYKVRMIQGLESAEYPYKTLKECCEYISKMLSLAHKVGWQLDFEIYSTDPSGNQNFIRWQFACYKCLSDSE